MKIGGVEGGEVTGTVKTRTCQINLQTIYTIYYILPARGMGYFVVSPGAERDIARFLSIVSFGARDEYQHAHASKLPQPVSPRANGEMRAETSSTAFQVDDSEERQETPRQQDQQMISHVSTTYKLVKKNTS